MSLMPAVRSQRASVPVPTPPRKPNEMKGLAAAFSDAGVSLNELFGWSRQAFRRVESVSASHVSLDFEGRAVVLPRGLLPRDVQVDQWLRFEKDASGALRCSVDLRATLTAESRLSDLFQALVR